MRSSLPSNLGYLPDLTKRVTTPRGHASSFGHQAFDDPDAASITSISAPEGVAVSIPRDVFGTALSITRSGGGGGGSASATRSYVYDAHQRLCKAVEPESAATIQAYDAAGNIAWRASGRPFTGTTACDQASVPGSGQISFAHDAHRRLTTTSFGDGSQAISRSYTPDGLLKRIMASNPANPIGWNYDYNNRRLLTREQYQWWPGTPEPNDGWIFSHAINPYGHVQSLTDPWPSWGVFDYAPNALGQPTRVGHYASQVSYHPGGSVAGYTLANGRVFSSSLNARGLPQTWQHAGVSSDAYTYDASGNVSGIQDLLQGINTRNLGYDGLDRLTAANGPWGSGLFGYDALDNLVSSQLGSRTLTHHIDAVTNRLRSISGSQNISLAYDANGNLRSRGGQDYSFDIGNRITAAIGKATYVYDGHGRRNLVWFTGADYMHQAYTRDGKLRLDWRSTQGGTRHVYLGDRLIAQQTESGTTYSHTDALGSPVAKTDSAGNVLSRTIYEPYGATVAGSTNPTSIGFTGHVNDVDTGLVYMQQRYSDPIAGRFLSVDQVTTNAKDGSFFGRYHYANNNPYKFKDPDGRAPAFRGMSLGGGWTGAAGISEAQKRIAVAVSQHVSASVESAKNSAAFGLKLAESGARALASAMGVDDPPPVPDVLVGDQSDPRAGTNKGGTKHTSGKLKPEHGGSDDFAVDLDHLTGGVRPWQPGDRAQSGSLVGANGISGRPSKRGGQSIDIPAKGQKPHETLHYP